MSQDDDDVTQTRVRQRAAGEPAQPEGGFYAPAQQDPTNPQGQHHQQPEDQDSQPDQQLAPTPEAAQPQQFSPTPEHLPAPHQQQFPAPHQQQSPQRQVEAERGEVKEIQTYPPLDEWEPAIPISEATGQPIRDKVMLIGAGFLYASSAVSAAALAWAWWRMINIESFHQSVKLLEMTTPRPGSWQSVVYAILICAIGAAMVTAPALAAFNAWNGHKWSRIAGAVAVGVSLLAFLMNTLAWVAVPLAMIGAAVLWLPQVTTYFNQWARFRAVPPPEPLPFREVEYGPLPRYR